MAEKFLRIFLEEYITDDFSSHQYPVFREYGEVKNHLRQGEWKVIEKHKTPGNTYYVQGIGKYINGVKHGEWDYYIVSEDFSVGEKDYTVEYSK